VFLATRRKSRVREDTIENCNALAGSYLQGASIQHVAPLKERRKPRSSGLLCHPQQSLGYLVGRNRVARGPIGILREFKYPGSISIVLLC
jgi:hypothetical protein